MIADDRVAVLLPQIYDLLRKVYENRLLRPADVETTLASVLEPHQLAKGNDWTSVCDRAVREHNVRAISQLYDNVSLRRMGQWLGVRAEQAEEYVASMIAEGRLVGWIDQAEGLVVFRRDEAVSRVDARIQRLCEEANRLVTLVGGEENQTVPG